MIEQTVTISDKKVTFRASAAIPRIYRNIFGRDVLKDVEKLTAITDENRTEVISTIEDLAYCMAKHADPSVPETVEEWLETFDDPTTIYMNMPTIMELWNGNMKTTIKSKKKSDAQSVK